MRYIFLSLILVFLSFPAYTRELDCSRIIVEKYDDRPIDQILLTALQIKGVERLPFYRWYWELQFDDPATGREMLLKILKDYDFIFYSARCETKFNLEPTPEPPTESMPIPPAERN
jgi:hypothetical protein